MNLLWTTLILLLGAVLFFSAALVLGRYFRRRMNDPASEPFTLHDLRQMAESGQISTAEYETLRAAMIERTRGGGDARTGEER